jgi:hypothetical protein
VLGTPPAFVLSQDQTLQKLFKAEASFLNVDWLLMFKPIFARPVRQGLTRRFDEAFRLLLNSRFYIFRCLLRMAFLFSFQRAI